MEMLAASAPPFLFAIHFLFFPCDLNKACCPLRIHAERVRLVLFPFLFEFVPFFPSMDENARRKNSSSSSHFLSFLREGCSPFDFFSYFFPFAVPPLRNSSLPRYCGQLGEGRISAVLFLHSETQNIGVGHSFLFRSL